MTRAATSVYPFTEQEFQTAVAEWGCNCGPSALAFAARCSLDRARRAIDGFDAKRYTSPTMMKAALATMGRGFRDVRPVNKASLCPENQMDLVRIQWLGPWTAPGANPRWAYGYTHWVAMWGNSSGAFVFDCNGGAMLYQQWKAEIVPLLTGLHKRATGEWEPTHIWRLASGGSA
jgi:hypothetical protein